jgi:uncharacterized protein (TIGR02145 family)
MHSNRKDINIVTLFVLAILIGILCLLPDCKKFEPVPLLILKTGEVSGINITSADANGTIVHFGEEGVSQHGFCWSETKNPDVNAELKNELGSTSSTGNYSAVISNLRYNTTYYLKAYAIDNSGVVYGEEVSFTTGTPFAPTVKTVAVSDITDTSAWCGGIIMDDGGDEVTLKGVCWSTDINPTFSGNHTQEGSGIESFTSALTGLNCGTLYYVRAYATNSIGTSYGEQIDFTTKNCSVTLPEITTSPVNNITDSSAYCGGTVISDGGGAIYSRGVCWSATTNPTLEDNFTSNGSETGNFSSMLSGLSKSTTYYVRAYATNSAGTTYGPEYILRTYEGTVTDYNENNYWTVLIGDQIWMAENLRATHFEDGTAISQVDSDTDWENLSMNDKAYCWYANNTSNRDLYGGLYTWAAAVNGETGSSSNPSEIQGVCPDGWHLPSDEEWKQLEIYLGMSLAAVNQTTWRGTDEGNKLKEQGTEHWVSSNSEVDNSTGFTGLPGGFRYDDGRFIDIGQGSAYWTATDNNSTDAWYRSISHARSTILRMSYNKKHGFSVRCVKD